MSDSRQQIWIEAPVQAVWELIADVNRHPKWWPRVIEVECEGLEEGCSYRQVTQSPLGRDEMDVEVERLDDCEELAIRCIDTGTYARFTLTAAQDGTFVDGQVGMDPQGIVRRVYDTVAGKRFFRTWLAESLEAMREAACERSRASSST